MKKISLNIALAVGSLALTALLVEIAFRVVGSRSIVSQSDRPDYFIMPDDAPTLQDMRYSSTKPPHTFRIAVVGDSFTYAPKMQYDDAFPKRIERFLNAHAVDERVEVMNLGVPGYSTLNELPEVERALKMGADLVLLEITLNDPQRRPLNQEPEEVQRQFGRLKIDYSQHPILNHWTSAAWALTRLHNQRTIQAYIQYHLDLFDNQDSWERFSATVLAMKRACDTAGAKFGTVVFPLFDFPIGRNYPFGPIHIKLSRFLHEHKIPHLDLRRAYSGVPVERLQLIPGSDSHPNEIGHRIAAEAIFPWLFKRKLVPSRFAPSHIFERRDNIAEPATDFVFARPTPTRVPSVRE